MKEGKKNPKMESQMKWTNPVTFQMNCGEEGKKEKEFKAPWTQYFTINT